MSALSRDGAGQDAARAPIATQVWFGPAERPLYGWLTVPSDGRARGAVVLCPPMAEEGRLAHQTIRQLAEKLTAAGLIAFRFDYDGTGDSAGGFTDPDRLQAWRHSVELARAYVAGLGFEPAVAGMRLGATLAAADAARSPVPALVLWDPCATGRAYLREAEALYLASGVGAPAEGEPYRLTTGFRFSADTATELGGLALTKLTSPSESAQQVLVLTREDRPLPDRAVAHLSGANVTWREARGQDALLGAYPTTTPYETIAEIADWLGRVFAAEPARTVDPQPERPALVPVGSGIVRERSVRLGDAALYGVVSESAQDSAGGGPAPWIVILPTGNEHHTGPGRLWVDAAREWALAGRRVLRMDPSRIGDSPTRPGLEPGQSFGPEAIDDMRSVVRELTADGSPVAMLGLCSGAYVALEAAQWDHVDAVLAINPGLTMFMATRGTSLYSNRRRAGYAPLPVLGRLAHRNRDLAGGLWRIYRQFAFWRAPFRALRSVVRRGTRLQVLVGPQDDYQFTEVVAWWPSFARLRRSPRFAFTRNEALDHSMITPESQQIVLDEAARFVGNM